MAVPILVMRDPRANVVAQVTHGDTRRADRRDALDDSRRG